MKDLLKKWGAPIFWCVVIAIVLGGIIFTVADNFGATPQTATTASLSAMLIVFVFSFILLLLTNHLEEMEKENQQMEREMEEY